MANNHDIFDPVNQSIIDDLKLELRLQGHYLTGALEASLRPYKVDESGAVILTAEALQYLEDLEKGIPNYQITLDAKTIAGMTRYVELRFGYRGRYAMKVAIGILKKQQKEGNPTKGSFAFTSTGYRTEVMGETFDKHQPKYVDMLDQAAIGSLDESFHETKSGTV